ncbi:VCBS domain-containing protein [Vibrio fortis]|uniref:VCBS domain-containing protein n=1 Tax=Vibrio fortis TaxID=212667 RepID=UPI0021C3EB87|nr:VCBS domain-containing protein [Vibrio fortis]
MINKKALDDKQSTKFKTDHKPSKSKKKNIKLFSISRVRTLLPNNPMLILPSLLFKPSDTQASAIQDLVPHTNDDSSEPTDIDHSHKKVEALSNPDNLSTLSREEHTQRDSSKDNTPLTSSHHMSTHSHSMGHNFGHSTNQSPVTITPSNQATQTPHIPFNPTTTNNAPAKVSSATVSVDETDSAVTTSGTLSSVDVDNPDNTFTPESIKGTHGDLTINANGHWVFTANNAFNQLNVGDKVEETFTVTSVDGTPSTIKVTINGTNDAATVSSATVSVNETDKAITTSGTLTSTDVDNPDNTFTPDSINGTHGDLTIDANGHWVFTANNAFNQLNVGDKVEDIFTVTSVDGTPSTIKVTINGTNDAATVSSASVAVDETNKAVTTSGTLTSTDVDNPDNTFAPDSITGTHGNLTIDANGHWVFTANSAFNQLNVGDKVEETFTVTSVDGTPSTIKVTINGTNDAATVSSATISVDETDKAITTSGTLTSTDVDNPDNAFTPDSITGTHGNLTIDANGHWVFTANSAFNQLNVGDKVEETFTVTSVDGTPSTIKVTINGTNDAATVSSATVAVDETDKAITTSGTLTSTDVDNPDNAFTPDSITGTHGDLIIDANGHWVFTANSAFNQLNVGDKVEETFTVTSVDGTPSTIKVTINGTNDAATVSSAAVAIDETNKAVTTSGTLTSTDVDNADNAFTPDSITGAHGDLTIDANGHWVFTANSAFNQLNVGDKVKETFTVTSIDGTPSTIKVTINGTNDAATVSSASVAVDETDKAVTTSGTLTSTDVDNPDNTFTPDSITGTHGNLTIDANGRWVFTANSAFNQLNVGDKVEETFTVMSVDGTPSTIKVTINGTNDVATVSSATVAIDETDSAVTTSGTLTSTDVDNADNAFTPDSITGTHGDLTIDANGHWVFTANSAFNQLNVGDKVEETFTVTSVDGTPSTIKVTINGTNDAATVSSASVAVDETNKAVTTSGTLTSTDIDNPDNAFTPDSITGTHGDLTINANGHWVFTANSAFNQLNVGDKVEETFTVTSVDGTPSTIKVTINGTNDAATVSSATVAVNETDKAVTTTGTLTSTDVDNPDNAFTPDSITGTHGDLTINANGHWVFTANSAFNQLNVGDKVEETFTVTSVDGTPSTIKVTINGTNDAATVSSASVAVDETNKAVTTSGTLTSTDVDNPDNTFAPDSITGTHGNLTIDANGHWVFTANSAFNQLNVGDKVGETFTVTSVDGTPSTIKVTINGTNDAATVSSATVAVNETDRAITTSGTLTSTDVDNPDNTFTPDSITGTHGDLTIDANGHWVFTANSAFNQLNVGDKVEETFTVSSVDGTPSTIKVIINGTNDAATVSSASVAVDETDKAITTAGTLTSTDVDNPDNTFTPDSINGTHGDLTIDANGHWVFTANNAFNQLNVGDKVEETFTVTSVDGTPSTIKVTINGTNDAATVSSATISVDETDSAVTTSGTLTSTDVDNPDNAFTPDSITGTHGDLTIDANGHWVFTANSAFNQLNVGDKVEETFTVTSVDGTPSSIKVTISGTNDAATVSSATVAVDETDTAITTSGTLTSTDVDNPDNTFTPDSITGTHGDLTIDANGHWVFTANSAFNQLNVGDKIEETFTVSSVDGTPSTIKVIINGTNDAATVSSATVAVDETDKAVTTSGTLTSTDVDNPNNAFTPDSIKGANGDLTIDAHGHWVFTANSAFNQLNVGDKVEETFTVSSVDGTPSTIKVTINGTNDAATVSSATVSVNETDKAITTSGVLTSTDVDNPDNNFTPDSITGAHGNLTIDANGHWVFTANSAFNQLNVGDKVEETFTVTSVDGTPSTIKVTINGTNDAATVSSATVSVDETDKAITTSGTLNSTDVDNPDNAFTPGLIIGAHGNLTIDANGHWVFTANSSFNQLNVGDKVEETFTVSSVDGTPSTINVTINGTNDAATVSSATVSVDETDSTITTSGTLTSVDIDNPDNAFTPDSITGTHGDLTIDANGHWVFTANSAFNQLNVGDKVEETFIVTSVDGTPSTIKVTINGTNDAATVSSATVSVNETDKAITTSGVLTSTDVDNPDNNFTPDSITGAHGNLTIDANGHWVFTANSAFNQLNVGDKVEETFTVTSVDGTPSTIKVTINGTNDRPTISGTSSGAVIEQGLNTAGTPDATGDLVATDLDKSDTITWAITQPQGQWGTLSIDQHGHWHYQLDNSTGGAADKLAAGEHQSESFWITATDSAGATVPHKIVIDVQGSNDKPIVSAWTQLPAGKEDQPVTIKASDLITHASDVDRSDVLHVANLQATHGNLTDNKDGTYTFTPDKDFNGEIRLTYDVVDGHGGSVSTQAKFDLTATPDNALISYAATDNHKGGVTEDSYYIDTHDNLHFNGKLDIVDPDKGEAQFDINLGPQTYQGIGYDTKLGGHILIMQDGRYTYTIRDHQPLVQNLKQGETITDECVVKSQDGTPFTIKVNIHGTNDAPTLTAQHHSVNEDDSLLSGQMVGQDVDHGASLTYSIGNSVDGLTFNADGSYSFEPSHASYQSLAQGQTQTLTIPVTVTDEHGASATQNLEIVITGTNDAAKVAGVDYGDVHENQAGQNMSPDYAQPGTSKISHDALTTSGQLSIVDPDTNEAIFDTKGGVYSYHGQYGHLLLRGDGHWEYAVAAGQTDWQQKGASTTVGSTIDKLGAGETLTDTITIQTKDGTTHDIVVTIHGDNDAPYVSGEVQLNSGKEDLPQTLTQADLLANSIDVDHNDIGKLSIANLHADHGSIIEHTNGTYTFTPDKNYNGQVHFTYDVKDAHGGVTHTGATTSLAAVNDSPVATPVIDSVTEDTDSHHAVDLLGSATDVDGDPLTISQIQVTFEGHTGPLPIGVSIAPDGHSLIIDSHSSAFQHLSAGQTSDISVHYMVEDNHGGQTPATATITVIGTDDKAQLQSSTIDITESQALHTYNHLADIKGQFHLVDPDTGDHTQFVGNFHYGAQNYGELYVWPDGTYTYSLDWARNHHASDRIAALKQGETLTDQYQVQTTDGQTKIITVTIHGEDNNARIDIQMPHLLPASQHVYEEHFVNASSTHLYAGGRLKVVDPDHDDAYLQPETINTAHNGQFKINADGGWSYKIDNSLDEVQHLGAGESYTETHTVHSKDGTASQLLTVTVHGTNDAPIVSAEVKLAPGIEDHDIRLTTTELLQHTTDIDHNDVGHLSVANLVADHGVIIDNKDGTFTFQPTKDYNGQVHFSYDVTDAHGGVTHTGASTTLTATPDGAIISEVTTDHVTEDGAHNRHNAGVTTELANGRLQVIDPDSGEDKFQYSQFGETAVHDPFGGMLRIDSAGNWGYSVDNAALQHLAQGQVETVTYRVHSFDGTAYDLNIDVVGTNDAPTVTKVMLSNGTEDTHYQMQASQFGFTDVDTGDTLHSIAITDLPPAAQGKFVLDGHDVTTGQSISASDIAKLQFVPAPDFNGDVQFKFTVNDGHVDSQEATNTLHIDAVSDVAQFTGSDTGDVHEGHTYTAPDGSMSGGYVDDRSPDHMHGNVGKIWNDEIHTDGHLNIVDPDSGESHAQTGIYQGTHGHVILQSNGDWSYYASIGQNATGRKIDHLGQGESITDTVTVRSADGTTHDIHITIHGDNDRPYCSSEVQLNSGKEDLAQTITTTELLANTVDVDANDAGKLTIANLHADHGTIVDNQDGTYTFTPNKNYNGQVHFTYDVKDAHGGVTHTGASITLLPSNDAATLQSTLASNFVTEEHLKSGTSTNELWSDWKNLDIQDIDSPSEAKVTQIEVNGVKHTVPANFAMNLAGVHGTFNFTHSTDGHDKWSYSADNSHTEVQSLSHGESLTDTITLITADGTQIPLTAKILGTDDHVIIDTPDALTAALGTAVEDKVTSISGTLLAHDSDSKDSVTFTAGNSVGSYGTLHVDSDGQWHYDLDHSKANVLQQGETKAEGFDITATSTDGSTTTKHVEVLVQGSSDTATISVMSNPDVHEDSSSTPVEMISGKLSALDPDHDQSAFSTDVGKRHDPFNSGVHGGLHISKDGSWTYTVNNSQIQQLAAGQEEHVQYNVHTVGGDYHIIDIKIVGTNDIPTVSATTLAHGTEDTHYQMQASQFGFNDVDTGDTLHSIAITDLPPAAQGKFVLDGHDVTTGQSISASDIAKLQFVPALDFNGDVQFKFTVNDGHANSAEATNTLHIDAVSDAATITGIDSGSVTEDAHLQTSGSLTVTDPDSGEAHFTATSGSTQLGTYTIDASGHWTYSLNPRIQSLHQGETTPDVFTVHSADGTAHVIKVTITGTQDVPVITGQSTGTVYEDAQTTVSGTLNADDKDYGQSGFWAQSHIASAHNFGDLSIDQNGYWTFHLDSTNPAVNALGEHDTLQETVTVNTIDGTSKVIQITIHGTNDAPILGVSQTSSTTGTLTETDVDVSDTHTFSVVHATGQFGSLSVDPDSGAYVYTTNGSVAGMSYNTATHTYHGSDVFEVKVSDGHTEDSKFITFDANGHVSVVPGQSPTISTSVPSNPLVTTTQPSLPTGTNTPPNNAVTVDLAASSDSGTSDTDNLTQDSTPTITGHTDVPFSKVTIYDGSTPVGHAVSDASGQYSVSTSSLSDGDHNLSAKALAPSSVLPVTSSLLSVHIDTQVHIGIHTDTITTDNVINAQESNGSIDITGSVSGDFHAGDIVTLNVNGVKHTGAVDTKGHYSIAIPGSELTADADQKIEASITVTDTAGNSAQATTDVVYHVDTLVNLPTITFENPGPDGLYSKAEIAQGHPNTVTATITPPSDAKIGEHLVVNGQDHVLDAHILQHGLQIEVLPGEHVQATMTDEHGNTAGSQGVAASAIPEPIIVRPPSGSHHVSGTLGVPPLLPSLTPVPTTQSGWRIHLANGQYVTSHHGQYGTLTIDPQTGDLHYQEQAQVHTGPHGSASGIGQHEDRFEIALQGTNQDEVVAHVNIQILSHGPGHSGKLTVGTEVVDMTITPIVHASHPAPPPPPPVQHDEPEIASHEDFTFTVSEDTSLDLSQHAHQEPDQKTDHHGAAAYLDALGIQPNASPSTTHDQPADMDIVLAQVDQQHAANYDQTHLDMSDALEHHDAANNHNQDDEHHHHNDVDGLPDIDPNN